jgi:CubicO group peptidase (beta-lactamase class C family)
MMATKLRYGNPEEVGMSAARVRRIAGLAERWVAEGVSPALVVIAARRGVIVLHEAFGRLGPEPDALPLPLNAIFPIASVSKVITATAALILVEDGLLSLTRPVEEYIPEFQGEGKDAVMVHHLLTHTAGLEDTQIDAYVRERKVAGKLPEPDEADHPWFDLIGWARYRAAAHRAPLARPAGHEMSYSNFGFTLLGEIVERIARQPLRGFIQERIFGPLGMTDSCHGYPHAWSERVVRRAPDAIGTLPAQPDFPRVFDACGGACSTARDLAVFGQMLLNRGKYGEARILGPVTVAEMTRNQVPGIAARYGDEFFPEASWGLGVNVESNKKAFRHPSLRSSATFCHGGVSGVFWWVDPLNEIVGAYVSVAQHYPNFQEKWNVDLFFNAVAAAIDEV